MIAANSLPEEVIVNLTNEKSNFLLGTFEKPKIMGVLNITPDSFSDGGDYYSNGDAFNRANGLVKEGADIVDIGGESTRPGSVELLAVEELKRISSTLFELMNLDENVIVSVDTRKSFVMKEVVSRGVKLINDVSALTFDSDSAGLIAKLGVCVCLMHGGLDPKNMQRSISYDDVVLDVYDYLSTRIDVAINAGISIENIVVDPGIGFGKTTKHNLSLIRNASLFHSLGCPVLFGVSRKNFIGEISGETLPKKRLPGSIAMVIELIRQGVQIVRVHDVNQTKQAIDLWRAVKQH